MEQLPNNDNKSFDDVFARFWPGDLDSDRTKSNEHTRASGTSAAVALVGVFECVCVTNPWPTASPFAAP